MNKIFLGFILLLSTFCVKGATCSGNFVNPLKDVCWECMLPLTIGNNKISKNSSGNDDTENPKQLIQYCQKGNILQVGVAIGYWEPSYLVDVTREPYCMVNLGGHVLAKSKAGSGYTSRSKSNNQGGFYHTHFYVYPITALLNIIMNFACLQGGDLGLAYMSELDPTWDDDELSAILTPESSLFVSGAVHLACVADSVASTFGSPIDSLFWCLGSHGIVYPLTGHVMSEISPYKTSLLVAEKMIFKMHRSMLVQNSSGKDKKVCWTNNSAILPKSRWRYQLTNPRSLDRCDAIGRTPLMWEFGKFSALDDRNHGYLFFRKRNCVFL